MSSKRIVIDGNEAVTRVAHQANATIAISRIMQGGTGTEIEP